MLKIKTISAVSESQTLLKDINLEIKAGEVHAVMGPKHSGKSALAHVIAGHPSIQVTDGSILWKRKKLLTLEPEARAGLGIFVSFQFPPEFETLTNWQLAKELFGGKKSKIDDLILKYNTACEELDLGFGHGDQTPVMHHPGKGHDKKNELIHMLLMDPQLVILDEIDEGLSEEDTILVGAILKDFLQNSDKGCLVITHNQTLLKFLNPTHVHVMVSGEIKMSGDTELYTRIIEDGYSEFS